MNTTKRAIAVLAATATLATGAALTASAMTTHAPESAVGTTTVSATTTDGVAKQLQLTREEERMARDLYAALAEAHDNGRPMSMITRSEDQHHDAVGAMLTRYGLSDPSAGRAAGSYAYPEIQKLYDQWYAKGMASPNAAYQVGVELEKWDIAGLQKDIAATSQNDVKQLYTHLLEASQHHLAAYQSADSGQPVGPGAGAGNGMGNGMRNGMGRHLANGAHHGMGAWGQGQGSGPNGDCPMFDAE